MKFNLIANAPDDRAVLFAHFAGEELTWITGPVRRAEFDKASIAALGPAPTHWAEAPRLASASGNDAVGQLVVFLDRPYYPEVIGIAPTPAAGDAMARTALEEHHDVDGEQDGTLFVAEILDIIKLTTSH